MIGGAQNTMGACSCQASIENDAIDARTYLKKKPEPITEHAPVYQSHRADNGQASDRSLQDQVVLRVFDEFLANRI